MSKYYFSGKLEIKHNIKKVGIGYTFLAIIHKTLEWFNLNK